MPDIVLPPTPPQQNQPGMRPHFGRLKRYDPESLNYPLRRQISMWRSLVARLKTHVRHHPWWQGNQGATSQCGAYSALAAWEASNKSHGFARGAGHPLHAYKRPILKPEVVYDAAQNDDEWPGSEKSAPFYEGTSGTGAANAMKAFGLITAFDWEFNDIEACSRAIFTAPLVFGIDWKVGMMLGGPCKTWKDAVVKPTGGTIGGHLIAAIGFDKRRKGAEWELLNSWGREWGLEGRCYIGMDDLGSLLQAEGECVQYRAASDKDVAAAMDARLGQ